MIPKRLKILPFHPRDFDLIDLREHERESLDVDRTIAILTNPKGNANTITCDGKILGFFSMYEMWRGVYEVAVFPSIYVKDYPVMFTLYIRRMLKTIQTVYDVRRFQTSSIDDKQTNRWMKLLGFRCEGKLKDYTAIGVDYLMWARLHSPKGD